MLEVIIVLIVLVALFAAFAFFAIIRSLHRTNTVMSEKCLELSDLDKLLEIQLEGYPLHRSIMMKRRDGDIMSVARNNPAMLRLCFEDKTALEYALEKKYRLNDEILWELIKIGLNWTSDREQGKTAEVTENDSVSLQSPQQRYSAPNHFAGDDWFQTKIWFNVIQQHENEWLVKKLMNEYPLTIADFISSRDNQGRLAVDIASRNIRKLIQRRSWLCERFQLISLANPLHKSDTCLVHCGEV